MIKRYKEIFISQDKMRMTKYVTREVDCFPALGIVVFLVIHEICNIENLNFWWGQGVKISLLLFWLAVSVLNSRK